MALAVVLPEKLLNITVCRQPKLWFVVRIVLSRIASEQLITRYERLEELSSPTAGGRNPCEFHRNAVDPTRV
jgi:hypothetical protein